MTCRIAYICGTQGLSLVPLLQGITEPEDLMVFASQSACKEWEGDAQHIEPIESAEMLRAALVTFQPDMILVMTYLSKLDASLSELSKYGMINIHPSLLPEYRGGAPIFYALKNGEEHVGVTYHFMTEVFDQGDIIEQASIKVTPTDCASSVWLKVIKKIFAGLPHVIENRSQWNSMARKQDENVATTIGFPSLGERSLSKLKTVSENLSIIRACGRATGARLSLEGNIIFVTEASVAPANATLNESPETWIDNESTLLFKVLDGWLEINAAKLDGIKISSWRFLMEALAHGA
ncbi:formyltransferase family protein [Pseudomonas fluorescens]|uniref:Methionyl-tRNA formyltransferase n=2 Tax=Pseudomonas fluorescens group TaxID=136843 RepID=A0A5E7U320_PSEFL|nr:formyltransferase family protein [Pseudomonas fluorescens]VVQ05687.1 Methionyl-tRNA formyltransferase [Pseudomonas fluorescens]